MKPEPPLPPPSDLFWDAVITGGTPVATCALCGRVIFDSSGEFMDDGELDTLVKRQKINPDKYVAMDGTIRTGNVDGKQVVYGCPCNGARRYENWVWANRGIITRYLKDRTRAESAIAQQELNKVADL